MRFFTVLGFLALLFCKPALSQNIHPAAPMEKPSGIQAGHRDDEEGFPHLLFSKEQVTAVASSGSPNIVAAREALDQRVRSRLGALQEDLNVYKGCKIDEYTKALTYEHGSASRDVADFAMYSAIFSGPQADSARQAAANILTKWASSADYLLAASKNGFAGFCDSANQPSQDARFAVGLTFGRGVPDLVVGYEMLRMQNALTHVQIQQIDHFMDALYTIELSAMRYRADNSNLDCNRFSNHVSVQLAALTFLAAVENNHLSLEDIANGSGGKIAIPLSTQVSKAIYLGANAPLKCFSNQDNPELYQQISEVNDGEIVDRFRAKPYQTFGYPTFSLEHLLLSALVLKREGINPTAAEKARLVAALHYYGELLSQSQAGRGLSAKFRQYQGKNVFGPHTADGSDFALNPFIIGSVLFPDDGETSSLIRSYLTRNGGLSLSPSIYLPLLAGFRND
ncbi:hypothetical protein [Paraburkholderia sp. BCC1886]|uniref:hypothetical protein n=1 Tax=Paraburkholderia sp. BCC1886 TaxID=2562670 RepID=UPI001181CE82|nr:hypothetical protein [Paraburkholderia sp. BCC1886]